MCTVCFPCKRVSCSQAYVCSYQVHRDAGSQGSGDDGERQDGAAGLQLQGGDEALGGGGRVSLGLQNFAQAVPHVVSRAEDRGE